MSVLDKMVVQLGADLRPLVAGLNQTVVEVSKTSSKINKSISAIESSFAALGVAFSAVGLAHFAKSSLDMASDLKDSAEAVGITTKSLQELRYAALDAGIDAEAFDKNLARFAGNLGDAARGSGSLKSELEALGVSVTDTNGNVMNFDDSLNSIAEAIRNASSEQERLSIAAIAFGEKQAPAMVRVLRDGAAGLDEFRQKAEAAGVVMSEDMIEKADALNKEFERLEYQISFGLKSAFVGIITDFRVMADEIINVNDAVDILKRSLHEAFGGDTFRGAGLSQLLKDRDELTKLWSEDPQNNVLKDRIDLLNKTIELNRQTFFEFQKIPAAQNNTSSVPKPPVVHRSSSTSAAHKSSSSSQNAAKTTAAESKEATFEITKLNTALQNQIDLQNRLKDGVSDTFDEFSRSIQQGQSALDALKSTLLSMMSDIAGNLIKVGLGGNLSTGLGGTLAGMITNAIGATVTATSGPMMGQQVVPSFRAEGGPVLRGSPYIVGEKGPELFVPRHSGSIVPNNALQNSGRVIVNQTINVSTGVQATVQAELTRMLPKLQKVAIAGVKDNASRTV